MEEERIYMTKYMTRGHAIEGIAYAMGVLQVLKDREPILQKTATKTAYNCLERVMEALQDGGIVDE